MGRPSHARSLSVWSNEERVGTWTIPARGDSQFLYDREWRESAFGRPLSLSLPYTGNRPLRGAVVRDYFDNLLPDSEPIRKCLASHFKLASIEAFELLQEIGRDCVGAVQLLNEDEVPTDVKRIEGTPMLDEDVERHLIGLTQARPAGVGMDPDNLRISLAGAQEKTALLWHNGGWMRPHGSTPTTHILKLPLGLVGHRKADLSESVEKTVALHESAGGIRPAGVAYRHSLAARKCLASSALTASFILRTPGSCACHRKTFARRWACRHI